MQPNQVMKKLTIVYIIKLHSQDGATSTGQ